MSEIHHVVPMIYNAAYNEDFFKECDTNFQAMFKSSTFRYIFSQIQRTNHFLEVYKKLSEKNIKILVFKGIIFRNMYNNPDDSISSDEDILIKKEDYEKNSYSRMKWDDIYTNIKDEGSYVNMDVGDTKRLETFRVWQGTTSPVSNKFFEPDKHYEVIYGSDCLSLTKGGGEGR